MLRSYENDGTTAKKITEISFSKWRAPETMTSAWPATVSGS